MTGTTPAVSIVIATFRAAASLEACLHSIESQTGMSTGTIETIVIDGGSTDGTVEIIERHAAAISYWHSRPDDGIYDAWNQALLHARGTWIMFVGADDELAGPTSVADLLAAAEREHESSGARVVYGTNVILDLDGVEVSRDGAPWAQLQHRFVREMVLPHPGTLHRSDLFAEHGGFDTSFRIAGDYDLLLRELVSRPPAFAPDVVVARVGAGGVSRSARGAVASMREARRARLRNGLPAPLHREIGIHANHWASVFTRRVLGPERAERIRRLRAGREPGVR